MVTQSAQSAREAARNAEVISRNLLSTTAALDSLVTRVNSGRGALGQLVNDTSLVNELRATNTALRELLVDIKADPGRYIRLRL